MSSPAGLERVPSGRLNVVRSASVARGATGDARRPTGNVPLDETHEFFTEWLLPRDPAIASARRSLSAHGGVPYRVVVRHGRVMIYAHRLRAGGEGRRARWCCG